MSRIVTIRKIGYDTILNIVSYAIPILALQFVVFPFVAKYWDTNDYGLMLSLTSIVGVAAEMAGGTLSNVKLILNSRYKEKHLVGDYTYIFLRINIVIIAILLCLFTFIYKLQIYNIILLLSYFSLFSIRSYLTVGYRLELKYNLVFINNIILCVGYLIGLCIAVLLNKWEYIYILGLGLASVHLFATTNVWKEPQKKTILYKGTVRKDIALMGAYFVGNSMNYFDRVFLYAIAGALIVSGYYVATVFGKVMNLLITPINMVMLSYLSKKNSINISEITYSIIAVLLIALAFTYSANMLAPFVLKILYPQYYRDVLYLIPIATFATVLTSCTSLFKTLAMRYISGKSIFIIEFSYITIYVILAIILLQADGLKGFCTATIIATFIRLLFFAGKLFEKANHRQID